MDTERLMMAAGRSAAMMIAVTAAVCPLVFAGAGQAVAGTRMAAGVRAAAAGGTWHTAQKVPGAATLNKGGEAQVYSVSCGSAGNCSAGGYYTTDSFGHTQAFVVSQVHGTWHTAMQVPGTAALNQHGNAGVTSVSCGSAGNCSAGGLYIGGSSWGSLPFVVSQVNGTWRTAVEVPGIAALDRGGAWISSVSCGSAGNCSAGGSYHDSSGGQQVFVVSQVSGFWHTARQVPGTAALNTGGSAYVYSVSCASAGNCSAGGSYFTGYSHAFVVSEVNGTWRTAIEVPGTAALNQGRIAYLISMSCASAGNCSAGGTYTDSSKRMQAFVVSEVNGTWHTAREVPGTAALNTGGNAFVQSVSCTSAGNCSAGGGYTGSSGHRQAFVVTES